MALTVKQTTFDLEHQDVKTPTIGDRLLDIPEALVEILVLSKITQLYFQGICPPSWWVTLTATPQVEHYYPIKYQLLLQLEKIFPDLFCE